MEFNKREDKVLKMFFDEPQKHFQFKEIIDKAKLHRDNINNWLTRLQKKNLIKRVKPKGKFPYYMANYTNITFKNRKKLYALTQFYESGFLNKLSSLEAKAVIIFGSFSRSDWHKGSDIDLFVYGKMDNLDLTGYEKKLQREIQVFSYKSKQELKRMNPFLLKNIISGYYVKGNLSFLEVS